MPTMTDAELAECLALLGDISQKYGKLDGDFKTKIKRIEDDVALLRQRPTSGAGGHEPTFRELLQLSKEFQGRPIPAPRGLVLTTGIATKDILNVSRGMPQVVPVVAGGPRMATRVASLIPRSATSAGAVTYTRETAFTNNANVVAEGAAKPKSDKTFVTAVTPVEVIAHYFKVSRQSYEDLPSLAAQIEANGIYGVDLKLEQQILKGTGVAPQLGPGLYTSATAAASAPVGTTMLDRIFLAGAEVNNAGWQTNGVVMNASDYVTMTLAKDTQGRYLGLSSLPLPPVVISPSLAAGEFLVGDFTQAHLFIREDTTVGVAAQNEDDYIKNQLTVLIEMRVALVTYQIAAFRKNGVLATTAEAGTEAAPTERARKS